METIPNYKNATIESTQGTVQKLHHPSTREGGISQKMILDYVGEGRGLAKDDESESEGMSVFHQIIINCVKTCLNFTIKIMIFIKILSLFSLQLVLVSKRLYIGTFLVYISYMSVQDFQRKMTSSFREGGRGKPKDDSGLCGGRGGLKLPKKG